MLWMSISISVYVFLFLSLGNRDLFWVLFNSFEFYMFFILLLFISMFMWLILEIIMNLARKIDFERFRIFLWLDWKKDIKKFVSEL